ncbi:MAG: acetolactate synthase small subunit [Candidatus Latescibacterota bacterium]
MTEVPTNGSSPAATAPSNGRSPSPHKATIGLLVNDRPGVLVRVSQVFSRRGYNIESLVVSPSHVANTSRMTLTCSGPEDVLQQIILQLDKLVDVIHARDHTGDQAVTRELALFKVGCTVEERSEVLQIAEIFRGKAVDISENTITIESTGTTEKMDALESMLGKFDLKEMVRTGKVVMARGSQLT